MRRRYENFMEKFLMFMGLVMLYITVVYIVPTEVGDPFDTIEIFCISIAYIPWAIWYFLSTFKNTSETN